MKLAPATSKALEMELALGFIQLLVLVKFSKVWYLKGRWLRSLFLSTSPYVHHVFFCVEGTEVVMGVSEVQL